VAFVARFELRGKPGVLQERSRFLREAGHWLYLDERSGTPAARTAEQPGRNAPCPCGSGKKYKRCCGATAR
jgi:SEC-C motif-containing protein